MLVPRVGISSLSLSLSLSLPPPPQMVINQAAGHPALVIIIDATNEQQTRLIPEKVGWFTSIATLLRYASNTTEKIRHAAGPHARRNMTRRGQ